MISMSDNNKISLSNHLDPTTARYLTVFASYLNTQSTGQTGDYSQIEIVRMFINFLIP